MDSQKKYMQQAEYSREMAALRVCRIVHIVGNGVDDHRRGGGKEWHLGGRAQHKV